MGDEEKEGEEEVKPPIKPEDRVAAYGPSQTGAWGGPRLVGVVLGWCTEEMVQVESDDKRTFVFHRKQLRRLIPKKDTRRRWWINFGVNRYAPHGNTGYAYETKEKADLAAGPNAFNCVEVVEVRNNKNG